MAVTVISIIGHEPNDRIRDRHIVKLSLKTVTQIEEPKHIHLVIFDDYRVAGLAKASQ